MRYSPLREPIKKGQIKEFKPKIFRQKGKTITEGQREDGFILDSVPGKLLWLTSTYG